jgi:hypothetical protein
MLYEHVLRFPLPDAELIRDHQGGQHLARVEGELSYEVTHQLQLGLGPA